QITREAERLAVEAGLPITPTRAVREGEWPIRRVEAASGAPESLGRAVADAVAHDRSIDNAGTLAVITTTADLPAVSSAVAERFGDAAGR
ncbi:hypothetical protein SB767_31405, partial [Bacillus sp. SIMBA_069]